MNRSDNPGVRLRRPSAIAAIVAVLIGASLVFPAGRHQWALSLFRQPSRFTTLAFKYAWLLPSSSTIRERIPLFFTITNEEGRATRYKYELRQVDPLGNTQTLSTASNVVTAGATWTVDTSVRPYCNLSPCRVEVVLPGHHENINFLVVLHAAARKAAPKAKRGHGG
ncbi:MAG TPA: hypothetical protein VMA95_13930 [Streptosporangiaceae bacterium]|nr:hypothetical protein [Streptosporangiaceae bacterium]